MDSCHKLEQVDIKALCISLDVSLREAIRVIDRSGKVSLALLVDEAGRLVHTLTDGDVRRAILSGLSLDAPVSALLPMKANLPQAKPVTASCDATPDELLHTMENMGVRQIVVLRPDGGIANVVLLRDLLPQKRLPLQAMIMAGGYGTRLMPLTQDTPKPMLPVGEKPLMEHIVEGLRSAGIRNILVTTHYHPEKIVEHFGSGDKWGVDMRYVHEDRPLIEKKHERIRRVAGYLPGARQLWPDSPVEKRIDAQEADHFAVGDPDAAVDQGGKGLDRRIGHEPVDEPPLRPEHLAPGERHLGRGEIADGRAGGALEAARRLGAAALRELVAEGARRGDQALHRD